MGTRSSINDRHHEWRGRCRSPQVFPCLTSELSSLPPLHRVSTPSRFEPSKTYRMALHSQIDNKSNLLSVVSAGSLHGRDGTNYPPRPPGMLEGTQGNCTARTSVTTQGDDGREIEAWGQQVEERTSSGPFLCFDPKWKEHSIKVGHSEIWRRINRSRILMGSSKTSGISNFGPSKSLCVLGPLTLVALRQPTVQHSPSRC